MSAKPIVERELGNNKWLNLALKLCATETMVLLGLILVELAFGRRVTLLGSISAITWLLLGGASILVSMVGFAKGQKNFHSVSVVAVCILIFILFAFRFALV